MAETIFDVVVVGGGPAGYTCAIRACAVWVEGGAGGRQRPAGRDVPAVGMHSHQGDAVYGGDLGPVEARGDATASRAWARRS